MQGDARDTEHVSATATGPPPLVERCPLDDTLMLAKALPQPGKTHACPTCGLWWP